MSYVAEGIVISGNEAALRSSTEWLMTLFDGRIDCAVKTARCSAFVRSDLREHAHLDIGLQRAAEEVSRLFRVRGLVFRDDSRTGERESVLILEGASTHYWGPRDELYVELDDAGMPRTDGQPIRSVDLDLEREYETCMNAIQIGLDAIGELQVWPELKSAISR